MVKILSRSGDSLADTYDVVGSIAGIEHLESRELTLVHEMGATLFSERFSGALRRISPAATAQGTNFNAVMTGLPAGASRIFALQVFTDDASRLANVVVSLRSAVDSSEIPIWVWDQTNSIDVRFEDAGAGVATLTLLIPETGLSALPNMLVGSGQPQQVEQIAIRGLTTAFGAGTVTVTVLVYLGLSQIGGLSSRGLPIPSW